MDVVVLTGWLVLKPGSYFRPDPERVEHLELT